MRQANGVTVNGSPITGKYSIGPGVITIVPVFTSSGDYTIIVMATGYLMLWLRRRLPVVVILNRLTAPLYCHIRDGVTNPQEFTQSQLEECPSTRRFTVV